MIPIIFYNQAGTLAATGFFSDEAVQLEQGNQRVVVNNSPAKTCAKGVVVAGKDLVLD